jgi:hypothetical protein
MLISSTNIALLKHTRDGMKVMPHISFLETVTTVTTKFTYIMDTSFAKLRPFLHKVLFIINTIFPSLHETLYVCRVKLFAETS